jgi:hypothetical protein
MKIPDHLQLFATPVVLSDKDEERLSVYLTGFDPFVHLLCTINEPDLRRLVVMELAGKKRWKILERLVMRVSRLERLALEEKVKGLL